MARRFSYFKETVLSVEENKKSDLPYSLGINKFADGKLSELYGKTKTRKYVGRRRCASPIYGSEVGFSFNRDPAANKGPGRRNWNLETICNLIRHDRSQDPQDPWITYRSNLY